MDPAAFTIGYSFQGARFIFSYLSSSLTDTDACYLALLHAGCIPEQGMACTGEFRSMQDYVGRSGVTDVSWHKTSSSIQP
ncbi:DUF6555 family protein [Pseudomonas fluorescens]|uniref:Uncharacterized protein n=1 Tax=Pseudomonas fluorescens TaxID=294 RepID=A0A5E7EA47_PSEFL|nr:DUF6555 family protein [Pseudomonas fluorescens]VVO23710.1 hypothetical protein PS723_04420 [Pseudomonas fluorescens]